MTPDTGRDDRSSRGHCFQHCDREALTQAGQTTRLQARKFVDVERNPRKVTSATPRSRVSCSSRARCGPSPAMKIHSGDHRGKQRSSSNQVLKPLSASRRHSGSVHRSFNAQLGAGRLRELRSNLQRKCVGIEILAHTSGVPGPSSVKFAHRNDPVAPREAIRSNWE
jgi:hypothetical protein